MMLGEGHSPSPTVPVPPWPPYDDPAPAGVAYSLAVTGGAGDYSRHHLGEAALTALHRFLPSNDPYLSDGGGDENPDHSLSPPVVAYSCDEFRMYEFKVRPCVRGRSHDWTECPYAHPGEKARRRDPRRFRYSGAACPDFRKGSCRKGDACEFAHGVFESWLHPTRYRTQPCKDGGNCRRRVCFFAHSPEQLRAVPASLQQYQRSPRAAAEETSYDGSPMRHHAADTYRKSMLSSPASTLNNSPPSSPPTDSPTLSPCGSYVGRASPSVTDVLVSLRRLQLSASRPSPSSWVLQAGCDDGSPHGLNVRSPCFRSLPTTPARTSPAAGRGALFDAWDGPAERVESGRELRTRIYEKLSRENSMERQRDEEDGGDAAAAAATPDVEWVFELVQ